MFLFVYPGDTSALIYLFYVHIYSTRRTFPSCDLCTALLNMPSRALPPPDAAGVGLPPGWPHGGYPGSCLHHHVRKSFILFPELNPTAFCCLGLPPEFRCRAHNSLHRQERAGGESLTDTHLGCTWLLVAENITLMAEPKSLGFPLVSDSTGGVEDIRVWCGVCYVIKVVYPPHVSVCHPGLCL